MRRDIFDVRRLVVGGLLCGLALLGAGCDGWFSPTTSTIIQNGQSQAGEPSPSPSPSCVTGSVSLAPASGTTDNLVAAGTVVSFAVSILDPNGAPVPALCLGPVTATASGSCQLQSQEPPTVLYEGSDPCTVTASHGGKSGSFTLQAAP